MILYLVILWIGILNFVTCECGERLTNQFGELGVEFGRCKWNELPIGMQRMYLIFLSDTQKSKNIQIGSDIACTRETFKKVV